MTDGEMLSSKLKESKNQPNGAVTPFRQNSSSQPRGTDQSCSETTIDSATPLLPQGSSDVSSESSILCESSSLQSEGDGSATSSDATLMTDLNTGSTFVGSPNKVSAGQLSRLILFSWKELFQVFCTVCNASGHCMELQIKHKYFSLLIVYDITWQDGGARQYCKVYNGFFMPNR
jgi:hypothetical protein